MNFILAQVFGGIALILLCISYFVKKRSVFFIFQTIADIFYALAFLVVGAYVGAFVTFVAVFRTLFLYFSEGQELKGEFLFLTIFVVLNILISVSYYSSPYDFLPILTSLIFTYSYAIKDMQIMRYVLLVPNSILILYNILSTTYVSAILDFVEVMTIACAIIKFSRENKKHKEIT